MFSTGFPSELPPEQCRQATDSDPVALAVYVASHRVKAKNAPAAKTAGATNHRQWRSWLEFSRRFSDTESERQTDDLRDAAELQFSRIELRFDGTHGSYAQTVYYI